MLIMYISTYIHKMWTFCQMKHGWSTGVGEEIWAGGQGCNYNPTLTIGYTKKLYLSTGVVSGGQGCSTRWVAELCWLGAWVGLEWFGVGPLYLLVKEFWAILMDLGRELNGWYFSCMYRVDNHRYTNISVIFGRYISTFSSLPLTKRSLDVHSTKKV